MATEQDLAVLESLPNAMLETATAAADWIIILPVAIALVSAAVLLMFRNSRGTQAGFAMLTVLAILVCEVDLFIRVLETGPVAMTMGNWLPPFGISFTVDAIGTGFSLGASFVCLIVLVYFQAEIVAREERHGFYSLVLLLLAGVTGAFMTGDLFNLYVWFEVMLIASFGLMIIGGRKIQLDAAVKYGFLNFLATTFFLIGLGYLYGTVGTLNMADISLSVPDADTGPITAIGALFLLAFTMKAAAFPVNAWLPASYHTPDPAVSALFGGLLTKVGVYALLRVMLVLMPGARETLDPVITAIAVATLILGPLGALSQTNLRRAIGFLVIGGIGAVFAGLAVPTLRGIAGGTFYAFHSMLTMTALYLVAGLIERLTQATDTRFMGGVYQTHSVVSIMFLVLVFAAAGLPPFLGFWPKLLIVESALGLQDWLIASAVLVNAFLTTIAGSRLWAHIFWRTGRAGDDSEVFNDRLRPFTLMEKRAALTASVALVGVVVVLGLWPNLIFETARVAASDLLAPERYVSAVGLEVSP